MHPTRRAHALFAAFFVVACGDDSTAMDAGPEAPTVDAAETRDDVGAADVVTAVDAPSVDAPEGDGSLGDAGTTQVPPTHVPAQSSASPSTTTTQ